MASATDLVVQTTEERMIAVIAQQSGEYLIVGTRQDEFVIQGQLTEKELEELRQEIEDAQARGK